MKRSVILFLIILLAKISSFSQTILTPIENDSIIITTEELKIANLIFIEHQSLLEENELLYKQLDNWAKKSNYQDKRIQVLIEQKDAFVNQMLKEQSMNEDLQKQLKRKNKIITGLTVGGVSVTIGLVLFLVLR